MLQEYYKQDHQLVEIDMLWKVDFSGGRYGQWLLVLENLSSVLHEMGQNGGKIVLYL